MLQKFNKFFSVWAPVLSTSLVGLAAVTFAPHALAQSAVWHPELLQSKGVGCRFGNSSDPNQNAFFIANGDMVSFVFTKLGEEYRDARKPNVSISPCQIVLPIEVEQGKRIEEISQTLTYGIVKSQGIQARLDFMSNFARRQPNGRSNPGDLNLNMATASAVFPAHQIINEPLLIMPQPVARVPEDERPGSPHKRFCNRERSRMFNYHSDIFVRLNKLKENATISFAIDGLDLKYEMGLNIRKCKRL
ncbi:MAG: hypothetical protein RI953_3042 [Pseudomonadota bacterium]|jgi:hypothetical protein